MVALLDSVFGSFKGDPASSRRRTVGIDIGASSIKVVELEDRNNVITLTTYGEIQCGPYAHAPLGESTELNAKQEQEAVVDLLRESAVQARHGVFSMPLSSSFVTVMRLPVLEDEKDVGARVQVEARKYIPVPINDVTLDWAEIKRPNRQPSDPKEVLLAAIQNDALGRQQTLMKQINMPQQPTEIECFSLIRSISEAEDTGVAVIDLGGSSSKLYVTQNGLLERIHRAQVGGAAATHQIANILQCDFLQAETKKRSADTVNEEGQTISQIHQKVFERPLQEFKRVIDQYEAKTGMSIDRLVLSGGVAQFPGINSFVSDALQRDVTFAQPFAKVAYPAFMEDYVKQLGSTFAVALGAALRQYE